MERLTYKCLKKTEYDGYILEGGKERVIQFGEGNFLRGFVDYFIDMMNEKTGFDGKVVVVQPIPKGNIGSINEQEGLYTLYLRGREGSEVKNEKRVISSISRGINPYDDFEGFLKLADNDDIEFIVSNTTEAGIRYDASCEFDDMPPASFPAKLTRLLYERFCKSGGGKGYLILSCELIDDNGKHLKDAVISHSTDWKLGDEFIRWVHNKNIFCSTLVDRIVTGYPALTVDEMNKENGYEDRLVDTAECFGLWVIEAPENINEKLPFKEAGLPVIVTDNHKPYKLRKVRILNGAHTSMVPVAILNGESIVRESMENEYIGRFVRGLVFEEVIPTIKLPEDELESFANDVFDRFQNPFIDHRLKDIALNSISKWTARVKPSLKDFVLLKDALPERMVFGLAALIAFYKKGDINDSEDVVAFFAGAEKFQGNSVMLDELLSKTEFFEENLLSIKGLKELVLRYLDEIENTGMQSALGRFMREH